MPQKASLHYDLALALKLSDNLPAAVEELKQAIQLDPQLPDAYYTLGVTLWQQGDFPAAVEQLRAAVRVKPDYAEAYYTLGTVLKQMKQLPEAAEALRKAIRLAPNSPARTPHWQRYCGRWVTPPGRRRKAAKARAWRKPKPIGRPRPSRSTRENALLNAGDLEGAISQFRNGRAALAGLSAGPLRTGAGAVAQREERRGEYGIRRRRSLIRG